MPIIEFRGAIDQKLYVRALRLAGAAPRTLAIILIAVGVLGLVAYSKAARPATWGGPLFVGLLGAFLLAAPYITARRALRSSSVLSAPFTGYVDESMYVSESVHGRSNVAWSAFHRAIVAPDLILLYISAQQFHMLSRAFFASDADWQQFRELVQARVPLKHAGRDALKAGILWFLIVVGTFVFWSVWQAMRSQ